MAFPLARKLLALNDDGVEHPRVEVILLSRNSADTGLRIFNTIEHYGLNIERAAFTNGESPYKYMEAFGADLLLSTNAKDVRAALQKGYAAATILPGDCDGSATAGPADLPGEPPKRPLQCSSSSSACGSCASRARIQR